VPLRIAVRPASVCWRGPELLGSLNEFPTWSRPRACS